MVTTSTMAALPITTPSIVREAFSLSPARAQTAKRMLSSQWMTCPFLASGKRIVGQQIVAGILGHDPQVGPADQLCQMRHFCGIGQKVAPAGAHPQRRELAI